jgi:hypothetical protein
MYWDHFDILEAHFAFYSDYHSGQWSQFYRRLCHILNVIKFKPGPSFNGYRSLSENGKAIYDQLCEKHGETNYERIDLEELELEESCS